MPTKQAVPEAERVIPLYLSEAMVLALEQALEALQTDPHLYRDVHLALGKVQRNLTQGVLTDVLAAWVGK